MKCGEVRLMLASPSFTGDFCTEYVASLVGTIKDCQAHGIKALYVPLQGMHWIDIARDVIASLFLKSDCTHLLQIDADLGWQPDAARRLIERDKDVIGGAYPIKTDVVNSFPAKTGEEQGNGLIEAFGLPGGFLLTKREVIEVMSLGKEKYTACTLNYGAVECAPLFTREMRADGYTGEDYMFCRRAIEHGFKLWLEPQITFSHVGKKAWTGSMA